MPSSWAPAHAERAALAHDLRHLTEDEWATPSLCEGLSVREVLAHLTAGTALSPARWFAGVVRCRFGFDRQVALRLAKQLGDDGATRCAGSSRSSPAPARPPGPGSFPSGRRSCTGRTSGVPWASTATTRRTCSPGWAEYYSGSDFVVVGRGRVRGLHLQATDGPFATGDGPTVTGPTLVLLMATVGRAACLDELEGDGVEVLRHRC